jgi:hypothetical protein
MKLNPSWEDNRFSAGQETSCIKWDPMVNYHNHKSLPPVPELSQINRGNVPPSHFLIHFNIIYPSKLGSSKSFLSLGFPHQNPTYTSPFTYMCYMPHPSHSSLFDHPNNIWWRSHIIQVPRYVIVSPLLLPHPSRVHISSSAPYSQTHSAYISPQCEWSSFTPI